MTSPTLHELLRHTAALRRLAADLVGSSDADDLLQDAAIVALETRPPRATATVGWLFGVVRNLAGKRRRADAVRRRHEQAAARRDDACLDAGAETADALRWLTEQLTSLPEPYREALLARYVRDESPTAIARERGEPVRTVKTRLARGLALLRERLAVRERDWRPALAVAFGLGRNARRAGAGAGAVAAVATGVVWTSTTTKFLAGVAAVALLAAGLAVWRPWRAAETAGGVDRTPGPVAHGAAPSERQAVAPEAATTAATAPAVPAPSEREPAPAALAAPVAPAAADQIVVLVHDTDSGAPILHFGLRQHRSPQVNFMAKEAPLVHAGEHAGGRLVMPAAEFDQRNFVVEAEAGAYLPSRWIDANDANERNGERVIDVSLAAPVDVTLRVVLEKTSEPVAGTEVELLRPWPGHGPVTLRTSALPSERIKAQAEEPPMVVAFSGGRALLLQHGTTDDAGRLALRVPPGEDLALRLLGPGHQPRVVTPWRVARADRDSERTVAVTNGAAIEVRVFPAAALARLQRPPVPDDQAARVSPLILARRQVGVRLRNVQTNELRPAAGGLLPPTMPLDAAGTVRIDGLTAGDWEPVLCYVLQVVPIAAAATGMTGETFCEVPLPVVRDLAVQELRVVDVDLTGWLPGELTATVLRGGGALTEGTLLPRAVAGNGTPLPQLSSPNLRFGDDGRIRATLPPGRYFAAWFAPDSARLPLGEFTIDSGATTDFTFAVDVLPVSVRVVEADDETAAAGTVVLNRAGWYASSSAGPDGTATIEHQLRGDRLSVTFLRHIGTLPNGKPQFGAPIELGELTVTGATEPTVFRLPPQ